CSKVAQIGQRGSSYSFRVFFALSLPMTTVVPFLPVVFAGATTFASDAASHAPGLLAWTMAYPTPPSIARTPPTEQATMICRLTFARFASRSRSARRRSRAAVFAAWLFRLLMLMFSMGGRTRSPCADGSGGLLVPGGPPSSDEDEAGRGARRPAPSQGVHEEQVAAGGGAHRRTARAAGLGHTAHGHRRDRQQQRPERGRRHRAQHLRQRPLAAPQPGRREQADPDARAEQQDRKSTR